MSVHPIDLANAAGREELAELINICEQTEPLLDRQVAADDLAAIFSDATAFHEEGQVWHSDTGSVDAVGYLRFFHVNAAMNATCASISIPGSGIRNERLTCSTGPSNESVRW